MNNFNFFKNFKKNNDDPISEGGMRLSRLPVVMMVIFIILVFFAILYAVGTRPKAKAPATATNSDSEISDFQEKKTQDTIDLLINSAKKIVKSTATRANTNSNNNSNSQKAQIQNNKSYITQENIDKLPLELQKYAPKPPQLNSSLTQNELSKFEQKKLETMQQMQLKAFSAKTKLDEKNERNFKSSMNTALSGGLLPPKRTIIAPTHPGIIMPGQIVIDKDQKAREFLKKNQYSGYLKHKKEKPLSKFEIKAGWNIPATLITGVNSELPGQILAQISENVYDSATGNYLLIPQGTKAIGAYSSNILFGQKRLLVAWTKLIFPNGDTLNIEAMQGTSMDGYSGFTDQIDNHYFKIFGSAMLLSAITAGIALADTSNGDKETAKDKAIAQAIQQMGEVASKLIQKNLDIAPTLNIRPGYKFNIFVSKDIVLEPLRLDR